MHRYLGQNREEFRRKVVRPVALFCGCSGKWHQQLQVSSFGCCSPLIANGASMSLKNIICHVLILSQGSLTRETQLNQVLQQFYTKTPVEGVSVPVFKLSETPVLIRATNVRKEVEINHNCTQKCFPKSFQVINEGATKVCQWKGKLEHDNQNNNSWILNITH